MRSVSAQRPIKGPLADGIPPRTNLSLFSWKPKESSLSRSSSAPGYIMKSPAFPIHVLGQNSSPSAFPQGPYTGMPQGESVI